MSLQHQSLSAQGFHQNWGLYSIGVVALGNLRRVWEGVGTVQMRLLGWRGAWVRGLGKPVLLDHLGPWGEKWEMGLSQDGGKSWDSRGSWMADWRTWGPNESGCSHPDCSYGLQRDLKEKVEMMGPVGFTEYLKISFGEYLDKLMVWGLMVEDATFILHVCSSLQS